MIGLLAIFLPLRSENLGEPGLLWKCEWRTPAPGSRWHSECLEVSGLQTCHLAGYEGIGQGGVESRSERGGGCW